MNQGKEGVKVRKKYKMKESTKKKGERKKKRKKARREKIVCSAMETLQAIEDDDQVS